MTETIYIDIERIMRMSVFELAQIFNVPVGVVIRVCNEHEIGVVTESGYIYIGKDYDSCIGAYELLEEYCKDQHIEEKIKVYIEENQPVNNGILTRAFGMSSREKMRRIIDHMTFRDGNLWSSEMGNGIEILFYGDRLADEYGE